MRMPAISVRGVAMLYTCLKLNGRWGAGMDQLGFEQTHMLFLDSPLREGVSVPEVLQALDRFLVRNEIELHEQFDPEEDDESEGGIPMSHPLDRLAVRGGRLVGRLSIPGKIVVRDDSSLKERADQIRTDLANCLAPISAGPRHLMSGGISFHVVPIFNVASVPKVRTITKHIHRDDGTEVKMVAFDHGGRGQKKDHKISVYRRDGTDWSLCSKEPAPGWKSMPRDEYLAHGRSELLRHVTFAEMVKFSQEFERAQRGETPDLLARLGPDLVVEQDREQLAGLKWEEAVPALAHFEGPDILQTGETRPAVLMRAQTGVVLYVCNSEDEDLAILDWINVRAKDCSMTDRPLAAAGLKSYRYQGDYGWVMIGARSDTEALAEAGRSVRTPIDPTKLEIYDVGGYRSIHAHKSEHDDDHAEDVCATRLRERG